MKILVKVKPSSKIEQLVREGDSFIVKVKEPAKEGRANRAVMKLLAEHFNVPKSQVRIPHLHLFQQGVGIHINLHELDVWMGKIESPKTAITAAGSPGQP